MKTILFIVAFGAWACRQAHAQFLVKPIIHIEHVLRSATGAGLGLTGGAAALSDEWNFLRQSKYSGPYIGLTANWVTSGGEQVFWGQCADSSYEVSNPAREGRLMVFDYAGNRKFFLRVDGNNAEAVQDWVALPNGNILAAINSRSDTLNIYSNNTLVAQVPNPKAAAHVANRSQLAWLWLFRGYQAVLAEFEPGSGALVGYRQITSDSIVMAERLAVLPGGGALVYGQGSGNLFYGADSLRMTRLWTDGERGEGGWAIKLDETYALRHKATIQFRRPGVDTLMYYYNLVPGFSANFALGPTAFVYALENGNWVLANSHDLMHLVGMGVYSLRENLKTGVDLYINGTLAHSFPPDDFRCTPFFMVFDSTLQYVNSNYLKRTSGAPRPMYPKMMGYVPDGSRLLVMPNQTAIADASGQTIAGDYASNTQTYPLVELDAKDGSFRLVHRFNASPAIVHSLGGRYMISFRDYYGQPPPAILWHDKLGNGVRFQAKLADTLLWGGITVITDSLFRPTHFLANQLVNIATATGLFENNTPHFLPGDTCTVVLAYESAGAPPSWLNGATECHTPTTNWIEHVNVFWSHVRLPAYVPPYVAGGANCGPVSVALPPLRACACAYWAAPAAPDSCAPAWVFQPPTDTPLVVRVRDRAFPAFATFTDTLGVKARPPVALVPDSIRPVLCRPGPTGALFASVQGGTAPLAFTLNGQPAPAGPWAGLAPGTYSLAVLDTHGCADALVATVPYRPRVPAAFVAQPPPGPLPVAELIALEADTAGLRNWQWHSAAPDSASGQPTWITSPAAPGPFAVELRTRDTLGCPDTARAVWDAQHLGLLLPTAFAPGGPDPANRLWTISLSGLAEVDLVVHDRWGRPVWRTAALPAAWDGNAPTGAPCPEGVYAWHLLARTLKGQHLRTAGTVTLLR